MIRLFVVLAFAALSHSGFAHADGSALRQKLLSQDGWVGYNVPMIEDAGSPCCYSGSGDGDFRKVPCDLDSSRGTTISDRSTSGAAPELSVYWHVVNGKADQIRGYAADCPMRSRASIRRIDTVDPRDSIAVIADWIGQNDSSRDGDASGLSALALHADPSATQALIGLADSAGNEELRKHALFWLGHARGLAGANHVERVARSDADLEMREHAVFALSQSKVSDAYERVSSILKPDAPAELRGKVYFWMAQMQDPRAQADIIAALNHETSEEAREQAVFALSQLDGNASTSALIAIVRGNYPRPVKEKALFWLGQAGTDEAMAFLDEVLTK